MNTIEFFTLNIFAITIFIFLGILIGVIINVNTNKKILHRDNSNNNNDNRINNLPDSNMGNNNTKINNRQNIKSTQCYENGEITNLCAIIALKTILRECRSLSNIEKDAINKGIDSIISMEKLNNFINGEESIDIEDYI